MKFSPQLWVYRLLPSLCVLSIFCGLSLVYIFGSSKLYTTILEYYGIQPYRFPFLDLSGSLAAWQCARQGIDVVVTDPCDELRRGYTYSPLWMALSFIPLGPDDRNWLGCVLSLLFILSLSFVPPTRRPWELSIMALASVSTMVVFAVERANPDIIVFILAVATGRLVLHRLPIRLIGYGLVVIGGLLKYYPLAMLIMTVRERITVFLFTNLLIICLGLIFIFAYYEDLERGLPLIVGGSYFSDLFSAKNLAFGMLQLTPDLVLPGLGVWGTGILMSFFLLVFATVLAWMMLAQEHLDDAISLLDDRDRVFLTLGCAVVVGCFFAGQNIGYRGILLLLALPGFLALARNARKPRQSRIAAFTSVVVVLLMWEECIHLLLNRAIVAVSPPDRIAVELELIFWLARELLWWWLISVMLAVLANFLIRSERTRQLWNYTRSRQKWV